MKEDVKEKIFSSPLGETCCWRLASSPVFRRNRSQPVGKVIEEINPILRGWVNYFAVGNLQSVLSVYPELGKIERKMRRHMMRAQQRKGFGWKRWSKEWLHQVLGLFNQYRVRYYVPHPKVAPAR
jgi:RNA-directed DNA polymerase